MNALGIDCALSKITIAAKKDQNSVKITYDIGIKQSEKLLPAIDFVMNELSIKPNELDYTTITLGPGSFTGLRLGLSSLKALNLVNNTPLYGIPSLEAYAYPFKTASQTVLAVIEAKEDEYFYQFFQHGKALTQPEDKTIQDILNSIDSEANVLVCGPAAIYFCDRAKEFAPLLSLTSFANEADATTALFELAQTMMNEGKPALQDYDGPLYVRKSEAELVLEQKNSQKQ